MLTNTELAIFLRDSSTLPIEKRMIKLGVEVYCGPKPTAFITTDGTRLYSYTPLLSVRGTLVYCEFFLKSFFSLGFFIDPCFFLPFFICRVCAHPLGLLGVYSPLRIYHSGRGKSLIYPASVEPEHRIYPNSLSLI